MVNIALLFCLHRVANIEQFYKFCHIIRDRIIDLDMIHYMHCIMTCSYTHKYSVCAVVSLVAVTEVLLATSSGKKEIKRKY